MSIVDKDIQRFASLNMTAALMASPEGLGSLIKGANLAGKSFPEHAAMLGRSVAQSVLATIDNTNLFSFDEEDAIGAILKAFLSSQTMEGRTEAEDKLTEGEMASNAMAMITGDAALWDGDETSNPFPGSGDAEGPGRISDLMAGVYWLLSEVRRLERSDALSDALHQQALEQAANAELPDPVDQTATQH